MLNTLIIVLFVLGFSAWIAGMIRIERVQKVDEKRLGEAYKYSMKIWNEGRK